MSSTGHQCRDTRTPITKSICVLFQAGFTYGRWTMAGEHDHSCSFSLPQVCLFVLIFDEYEDIR